MANIRVKLCLLVDGYKISIATATGSPHGLQITAVEESEVYGYGELAEMQLSTGERYLAGAGVAPNEPTEIDVDGVDGDQIVPLGDYWCYRVIPIEDEDVELVEYDEDGNVVKEVEGDGGSDGDTVPPLQGKNDAGEA